MYFLRAHFRISLLGDPFTLQVEIKIQFNVFRVFFYRQPCEIILYATRGSRFLSLSLLKHQKLTLGCTHKFIPPSWYNEGGWNPSQEFLMCCSSLKRFYL